MLSAICFNLDQSTQLTVLDNVYARLDLDSTCSERT